MRQRFVEGDLGLVGVITVAVAEQHHLTAVVGGVAVLHHEGVGAFNVEIMGETLGTHQAVVPRDEAFLGRLDEDESVLVLHHLFHRGFDERVAFSVVFAQA